MSPVRLLVVDDEPEMLRTVVRILKGQYDVAHTSSSLEAVELAKQFKPQLAIVDIRMPQLDGFELMTRLHEQDDELQVILMTGSVYNVDLQLIRALKEQAFYYINKPFDRGVLLALVERCIEFQQRQSQLIQSEKLASLGKLTAGVAHEISNPLNFVNNFSRISMDMLDDLDEELLDFKTNHPDLDWFKLENLLGDLFENLNRIMTHGDRASSVVQLMLDHANTKPGEHTPTQLVELIDQSYSLACSEQQSKEHFVPAECTKSYDPTLSEVDVVRTSMGKALLNIFRNAFYALNERKAKLGDAFQPAIHIETERIGDHFQVAVKDNGIGIPKKNLNKIFEPFFTTKPTGEGTGLGLSLANEIINRGHGGFLSVESKEGEGASFRITLPVHHSL